MRLSRNQLIENATATALRVRKKANISLREPINVYDLAEQLGLEVRFFDIPSMEGISKKRTPPLLSHLYVQQVARYSPAPMRLDIIFSDMGSSTMSLSRFEAKFADLISKSYKPTALQEPC